MVGVALRSVKPGEKAPNKPLSLTAAANEGQSRAMLVAMRKRIAEAIASPDCSTRDLASLSKRLMEIQRDIEAIDAREEQEASENAANTPDSEFDAAAI